MAIIRQGAGWDGTSKGNARARPVALANEDCPIGNGVEHHRHWFKSPRGGKGHCLGWHALHRDVIEMTARFPRPYLRGTQSNMIHRSAHTGTVTWYPEDFFKEGPSRIIFWKVQVACSGLHLKNPIMLDKDGARAEIFKYVEKGEPVTLCSKCFPRIIGR